MPVEPMAPATSKSAAEQFSLWGSAIVVVLGILMAGSWSALIWVAVLGGLGGLAVHLQPRLAPAVTLPGTRGSLLVLVGGVAAAAVILEIVQWLGWIFGHLISIDTVQIVVLLLAALAMAWGGYLIFTMEGGKFQIGMTSSRSAAPVSASPAGPPDLPTAPPAAAPTSTGGTDVPS